MSRPLLFHCPHVAEPWASPLAQSLPCQVLMWFLPRAQGPGLRSSSLASRRPSRGYTPSVLPTADARGQKMPVYGVSELGAQMRLCLHRPVVSRQL